MAKLVLKGEGREIELSMEPLSIGRRPENQLVVNDQAASGRHAVISFEKGEFFVEDQRSSNGTMLNGQRLSTRQMLKNGDVITVGRQQLEFRDGTDMLGTLVMMAPPKPQAPPPKATLDDGFGGRFIIPAGPMPTEPTPPTRPVPAINVAVPPPPSPAAPEPAAARTVEYSETDVNMLDQLVGSIRSHRDREQRERELKQAQVKVEWEKMVRYAEQMKQKVGSDPRIKYFAVSRSANDIMIRFQRDPKSPLVFIMFALQHPDNPGHALSGIWCRRTGEQDRCFQSASEAAAELVRELAFLIA